MAAIKKGTVVPVHWKVLSLKWKVDWLGLRAELDIIEKTWSHNIRNFLSQNHREWKKDGKKQIFSNLWNNIKQIYINM